jgi:hypothetical protein
MLLSPTPANFDGAHHVVSLRHLLASSFGFSYQDAILADYFFFFRRFLAATFFALVIGFPLLTIISSYLPFDGFGGGGGGRVRLSCASPFDIGFPFLTIFVFLFLFFVCFLRFGYEFRSIRFFAYAAVTYSTDIPA